MNPSAPTRHRPTGDAGEGLIETLIAVVLVGLAAAATLTTMSTTIRATSQHKSHAGAQAWLVGAADTLTSQTVPRSGCAAGEPAVRASYLAAVQAVTDGRPAGWPASAITVLTPVGFSNGTRYGDSVSNVCYDSLGFNSQAITIQVTSPDGRVTEKLTVVKNDG